MRTQTSFGQSQQGNYEPHSQNCKTIKLKKPSLSYREALSEGKRQLIKSLVENLKWEDKNGDKSIVVIWKNDFQPIANRFRLNSGGPA